MAQRWTLHIDLTGDLDQARHAAARLLAAAVGNPNVDPYAATLTAWTDWTDDHGPVLCGRDIPDAGLPWCALPTGHDGDCRP